MEVIIMPKKGQPKPKTLKAAEKELHSKRSTKTAKRPAGYVVNRAKGIKEKK